MNSIDNSAKSNGSRLGDQVAIGVQSVGHAEDLYQPMENELVIVDDSKEAVSCCRVLNERTRIGRLKAGPNEVSVVLLGSNRPYFVDRKFVWPLKNNCHRLPRKTRQQEAGYHYAMSQLD